VSVVVLILRCPDWCGYTGILLPWPDHERALGKLWGHRAWGAGFTSA